MPSLVRLFGQLAPLGLLLAACGTPSTTDGELLEAADTSSGIDSDLAKLAASLVEGDDVGTIVVTSVSPTPCAVVTANTGQNEYHFQQCPMPGIGIVSGDVRISYALTGPTLHMDVSNATALTVDRASVTAWAASADITATGADRTMIWQSLAVGSTTVQKVARGFKDDVSATLKWSVGSSCIGVDGQGTDSFQASDGRPLSFTTMFSSFVACNVSTPTGAGCPESGSEVQADLQSGGFVRVRYGQNNAATYTNERGQTFDFVPACAQ